MNDLFNKCEGAMAAMLYANKSVSQAAQFFGVTEEQLRVYGQAVIDGIKEWQASQSVENVW